MLFSCLALALALALAPVMVMVKFECLFSDCSDLVEAIVPEIPETNNTRGWVSFETIFSQFATEMIPAECHTEPQPAIAHLNMIGPVGKPDHC